jgi:hypothetical protein
LAANRPFSAATSQGNQPGQALNANVIFTDPAELLSDVDEQAATLPSMTTVDTTATSARVTPWFIDISYVDCAGPRPVGR